MNTIIGVLLMIVVVGGLGVFLSLPTFFTETQKTILMLLMMIVVALVLAIMAKNR